MVGAFVGLLLGALLGLAVGEADGEADGCGEVVGEADGECEIVGLRVGDTEGLGEGAGDSVGADVGFPVGLGLLVGVAVGATEGLGEGAGDSVGASVVGGATVGNGVFLVGITSCSDSPAKSKVEFDWTRAETTFPVLVTSKAKANNKKHLESIMIEVSLFKYFPCATQGCTGLISRKKKDKGSKSIQEFLQSLYLLGSKNVSAGKRSRNKYLHEYRCNSSTFPVYT